MGIDVHFSPVPSRAELSSPRLLLWVLLLLLNIVICVYLSNSSSSSSIDRQMNELIKRKRNEWKEEGIYTLYPTLLTQPYDATPCSSI